jgi:hypothetical protein
MTEAAREVLATPSAGHFAELAFHHGQSGELHRVIEAHLEARRICLDFPF